MVATCLKKQRFICDYCHAHNRLYSMCGLLLYGCWCIFRLNSATFCSIVLLSILLKNSRSVKPSPDYISKTRGWLIIGYHYTHRSLGISSFPEKSMLVIFSHKKIPSWKDLLYFWCPGLIFASAVLNTYQLTHLASLLQEPYNQWWRAASLSTRTWSHSKRDSPILMYSGWHCVVSSNCQSLPLNYFTVQVTDWND